VLGLLHAELGVANSRYGPVSLEELRRRTHSLWLLGHIHHPKLQEVAGAAAVLYPGSPQAMDAGEQGVHGVWIAELRPGQPATLTQIPLSTARYDSVVVELDGVDDEREIDTRVNQALLSALESAVDECESLRLHSCRLRLVGRTPLYRTVARSLGAMRDDTQHERGAATLVIDKIENETRPPIDLAALARSDDAAGVLARLLQSVDSGGEPDAPLAALLRDAGRRAARVLDAKPYQILDRGAMPDGYLAPAVRAKAVQLLDELVTMKAVP